MQGVLTMRLCILIVLRSDMGADLMLLVQSSCRGRRGSFAVSQEWSKLQSPAHHLMFDQASGRLEHFPGWGAGTVRGRCEDTVYTSGSMYALFKRSRYDAVACDL